MNTRETLVRFAVIAALGAFAFGCKKERAPATAAAPPTPAYGTPSYGTPTGMTGTGMPGTGTTGAMGGGPVDVNSAVNRIAEARCEREMTCGNIGGDKKFVDRVTCMSEARKDAAENLKSEDCPAGAEVELLTECVTAARTEDCAKPFNTIGGITACGVTKICRRTMR